MNLLDKGISLDKIFKPGLMLLVSVFLGCETQEDLGIQYELESNARVQFIEIGLPSSNYYIDSLRTDNEGLIVVGNDNDEQIGTLTAEGYFTMTYREGPLPRAKNSSTNITSDTLKVDSVVLILESFDMTPRRVGFFQEFILSDLQDTLETRATYLASFRQTPNSEVGVFSDLINSAVDSVITVSFNDQYAQLLFDNLSDIAGDTLKSINTAEFPSFGLTPSNNSTGLTVFNMFGDSTEIVVYSSPVDPNRASRSYQTFFNLNAKSYSFINRNRTGSSFEGITEGEDFTLPNGETYIDPIRGISTTFSLDSLIAFFNENERIIVNNATLSFDFEAENGQDTLTSFTTFLRKSDGTFFGPALAINSFSNIVMENNGYISLRAEPIQSTFSENKTKILQSPTLFFQQLYRPFINSNEEISKLIFTDITTDVDVDVSKLLLISLNNITLNRTRFKPNGIKLKIYYTEIDQ